MTAGLLYRAAPADLEIRETQQGRTVCGLACPFDKPTQIRDALDGAYTEVFRRGAFNKTIQERQRSVKALALHDTRKLPLGRATLLREDSAGLYAELLISRTSQGDEILELVRDGALDSLSIGFRPVNQARSYEKGKGIIIERTEVALREVSLVPFGAYEDARVLGVREDDDALSVEAAHQRLTLIQKGWPVYA